ncbi:7476_t:CDS:2 [Cetraspora pellucida]|uniref:7476_t:CDS:1 n=1 Tax=Cetraspora pellucida TaxID=1433469 RepID=A0A9N9F0B6_9GLOM|nr:7476_t:CDS:2 [Cetraspora pellucida]
MIYLTGAILSTVALIFIIFGIVINKTWLTNYTDDEYQYLRNRFYDDETFFLNELDDQIDSDSDHEESKSISLESIDTFM